MARRIVVFCCPMNHDLGFYRFGRLAKAQSASDSCHIEPPRPLFSISDAKAVASRKLRYQLVFGGWVLRQYPTGSAAVRGRFGLGVSRGETKGLLPFACVLYLQLL